MINKEVSSLIDSLRQLSTLKFGGSRKETRQIIKTAQTVLFDIFKIGVSSGGGNDLQLCKKEIGSLLQRGLPFLAFCFNHEINDFPTSTFDVARTMRSGIQFIIDDYSSACRITDLLEIEVYDDCLKNFIPGITDPWGGCYNCYHNIPRSHWWWHDL
jgi:hypothetical protein